jgi:hypothetical protein
MIRYMFRLVSSTMILARSVLNGLSFVRRTDSAVYRVLLLLEQSSSRNNKNCSMEMLILVV